MVTKDNHKKEEGIKISLSIPIQEPKLFRHETTDKILHILSDNPYNEYTFRRLARLTGYSHPAIKKAVGVLENNDLVKVDAKGNKKNVSINRSRLAKPDDRTLQIPQKEFHEPVKKAVDRLKIELDDVLGILIFGSVARGQADRQSDIDLWVLVQSARGTNQRKANEIAKDLEKKTFNGNRYEFQVLVESSRSATNYNERLQEVLSSSITLHETKTLQRFKKEVNLDGK
ncbi:MAG: nucleotidyltransferase domain-containing protein [Thermoplasmatota archaeon]